MSRFRLAAALGLAASLTLGGLVSAGVFFPPEWRYETFQIWQPVEQQTPCLPDGTHCGATNPDQSVWVVNRTGCAWDVDDRLDARFGWLPMQLLAGESSTGGWCYIADTSPRLQSLWIEADRYEQLTGRLSVGPYSVDITAGQRACIVVEYDSLEGLPAIPDSNGGVGQRLEVRFTVTNPSSRRIRSVHATAALDNAGFLPDSSCSRWPYFRVGQLVRTDPDVWMWVE